MIYVVTGLPRSGTTLMMRMLEAGGIEPYFDGGDNPSMVIGNTEYVNLNVILRETHRIKDLKEKRYDFLKECEGKAIKNLVPTEVIMPEGYEYRFIWMDRSIKHMTHSQRKFGKTYRGLNPPDYDILYRRNVMARSAGIAFLKKYPKSNLLIVKFESVLKRPKSEALRVAQFCERAIDVAAMAKVVTKRTPANYVGFLEEKIYMAD